MRARGIACAEAMIADTAQPWITPMKTQKRKTHDRPDETRLRTNDDRNPTTRFPLWFIVFYLLLWALTVSLWLMELFG
jgi:hypothetical protein